MAQDFSTTEDHHPVWKGQDRRLWRSNRSKIHSIRFH